MAEVQGIYQKIMLEFLFELYVFYALTTRRLNRAPRFWLRALGGLAAVLALAWGPGTHRRLRVPVCRRHGPPPAVL